MLGILLSCAVFGAILLLHRWMPDIASRFPSYGIIALYLTAAVIGQATGATMSAVRLTRSEPFIPLNLVAACLMLIVYTVVARGWGELAVALRFFAVTALVMFPSQMLIYWPQIPGRHTTKSLLPSGPERE